MSRKRRTARVLLPTAAVEASIEADVDLDNETVLDSRGNRLTAARAQEWAEDALQKIALRGRPSLTHDGRHSPKLQLRVPDDLLERTRSRAKRDGKSVSQIAREALERYLAS